MVQVRCLKDALMPLLWLNCVFCMGIFEIPSHRPRLLLSVIYTLTMVIGYFVLLYEGIVIFERSINCHLVLFYCVASINIIVATFCIILFWRKSQNFNILITKLNHVDNTLEALGRKKNYRKIYYDVIWCIVVWIICMILLNIMHIVWMWRNTGYLSNLYTAVCFGLPIMINSVVDVTFGSFVRCVQTKFRYTNILINDVVLSANDASILKIHNEPENTPIAFVRSNYKNNKDMIIHLLQTLRQLHLELTRISHYLNRTFCGQILLAMAVHFTIITAVFYSLYNVLSGNNTTIESEKVVAMITWGSIYSIKIIMLNNICTTTSREAYKTGEIVQTFEGSFLDEELREEIRQFTEQIILNSLHFTAAGFFKIDNVFTGSFFATVTTYVVILIQMSSST